MNWHTIHSVLYAASDAASELDEHVRTCRRCRQHAGDGSTPDPDCPTAADLVEQIRRAVAFTDAVMPE